MTTCFGMMDVVVLKKSQPKNGVRKGERGTLVGSWAPGVWEVEFCHTDGRTKAMLDLKEEILTLVWSADAIRRSCNASADSYNPAESGDWHRTMAGIGFKDFLDECFTAAKKKSASGFDLRLDLKKDKDYDARAA